MRETGEDGQETGFGEVAETFSLRLPSNGRGKHILWTVAGFDPSSGAGVTADLMTFAAHGFFGCSAITALTVQSTLGVFGWQAVAPELLRETVQRLEEDLPAAGVKVGMVGTPEIAETLGAFLRSVRPRPEASDPVVVYDPVLRSSSGRDLFPSGELPVLHAKLLPWVDWLTPNWPELELLAGQPVQDLTGAEAAARSLIARHPGLSVVATGGDQQRPTDLLVRREDPAVVLEGQHIVTTATHGTGCAFSSALLARLVEGCAPREAVRRAKVFVEGALRCAPVVGRGRGPLGLLPTNEAGAIVSLEKGE